MIARLKNSKATLKNAPGVLYRNVASLMRKQLLDGKLVPGDRLPSIEAMAKSYSVAIVTVRQAIALLEEEGLVERRHGQGTFVTSGKEKQKRLIMELSWSSLIQIWGSSTPRALRVFDAVGTPLLGPEDGVSAPVYRHMRRVQNVDGIPYAISDIYVDRRIYSRFPDRFDRESVIVVLNSLKLVKLMRQKLTIGTADLEVASLLDIPVNSAVGIVRRVIRDRGDVAIYVGEAIYRGDMVQLTREFKRPHRK